ncbi:MAG TPA: hypothetical protein VGR27_07665 [Longimicrobiaceae bacterium]|nr:hypothetical protein [Longimicrobiaceae bacterium]
MIGTLLKLVAYSQAPETTLQLRKWVSQRGRLAKSRRVPLDLRQAWAPRLAVVVTAVIVGPLAYRLGRRSAQGTLWTPGNGEPAAGEVIRIEPRG